ncbi:Predicted kinase [Pseudomonas flavescens]|uniref:Predicted kinase n=1 Tax=Phytopseudomonas flavescens TaxID=29435 RepID=A0A1G7XJ61_9GAMM|nr:AAA family ATPase [Pseudomonas flavescens]SDG84183.1 Predicted kinase [Pseudomonas flavescens]
MLIVFSGLPGTGKTTLAKALATHLGAVYLRIDSIEQALRNSGALRQDVDASGYQVANAIALDNLKAGLKVVADCVNPVSESREAWADTAAHAGCRLLNVQIICSDAIQHRQRVESRVSDVPGLVAPHWQSVVAHEYEPWGQAPLTIDTALTTPEAAQALLAEYVATSQQKDG